MLLLSTVLVETPGEARRERGPATPEPAPGARSSERGALETMLQLVPDDLPRSGELDHALVFADAAGQLAALGLPAPTADLRGPDDLRALVAVGGLAWPYHLARNGHDPTWREAFGFDRFQVDLAVGFGELSRTTTILRGRFDRRELAEAWARTGFLPVPAKLAGATAVSFPNPGDLRVPAFRLAISGMFHAVILPDGILVFSQSAEGVRAVLDVVAGRAPSLAERPAVAALLDAAGSGLVSAALADGELLRGTGTTSPLLAVPTPAAIEAAATANVAIGRMPTVRLALLGTTAGGPLWPLEDLSGTPYPIPPDGLRARFRMALLLNEPDDAVAAAEVVADRLARGRLTLADVRWDELFPAAGRQVAAVPGAAVVLVDLGWENEDPPTNWRGLLHEREFGFAAW